MTPTCYTTKEELALMERQGMGLMYDRLRGDECIALYSEGRVKEMIRAEREACIKIVEDSMDGCAFIGDQHMDTADAIRARGDE